MRDDLVKRLRHSANFAERGLTPPPSELREAADAIEELVRKEKFHAFLWNTIQPNEMETYLSMYNAGDEKEES